MTDERTCKTNKMADNAAAFHKGGSQKKERYGHQGEMVQIREHLLPHQREGLLGEKYEREQCGRPQCYGDVGLTRPMKLSS